MVHRDIGSARITYPTGVKVSPVDPMTSANLPRELRMVPGVVSRPIRIGVRPATGWAASPASEQLIQQFLAQTGGDPLLAFGAANTARRADPQNRALRNAEHALFSNYLKDWLGPGFGHAAVAASPAYSGLKFIGKPFGFFKQATPPSWREVQYGLRPLFGPMAAPAEPIAPAPVAPIPVAPAITSYVTVGTWPGAMVATEAQCQAYLSTHGGTGGCKAVYSDGSSGPLIPYTAPSAGLSGVGYYPNLGQDAGGAYLPASFSSVPTWVWWAGAGVVALLIGGLIIGGRRAPARPRVRTVTRTTF